MHVKNNIDGYNFFCSEKRPSKARTGVGPEQRNPYQGFEGRFFWAISRKGCPPKKACLFVKKDGTRRLAVLRTSLTGGVAMPTQDVEVGLPSFA